MKNLEEGQFFWQLQPLSSSASSGIAYNANLPAGY